MKCRGWWFVALVAAYLFLTAARDLQPFDSTEFVLNAAQLGVGHPPGQPFYLMLSALFVRALPVAPAFALSLLSALATLLALAISLPAARSRSSIWPSLAVTSVLFLPGVWDLATRPEVYAPAAALGLLAIALVTSSSEKAFATGVLLGLSASMNPVIACEAGLVVLLRCDRRIWQVAIGGLVGLIPYAALPLLGAHPSTRLIWGAPLTGEALVHFLKGADYRSWQLEAHEYRDNVLGALRWLWTRGILPTWLLGAIGDWRSSGVPLRQRLATPLATLFALGLLAANHPFIANNPDYDGYLLVPIWLSAQGIARLIEPFAERTRVLAPALVFALVVVGVFSAPALWSRNRHSAGVTRAIAEAALSETPPNGVLLVSSDHLVFPLLYMTEVENKRPDVLVINVGWASSSWYWDHLGARNPSLKSDIEKALTSPAIRSLPPRESRLVALSVALRRPTVAESLRLASLAGGRPCPGGLLQRGGELCSETASNDGPAMLSRIGANVLSESFEERLLAHTALTRADDAWLSGDPATAWRWLLAGLPPALRRDLPSSRPSRPSPPFSARAQPSEPRVLASPDDLLQRLTDLAR